MFNLKRRTIRVQQRQDNAQNDFCSKSGYELPTSRARRCNLEWYSSIIKYYDNASCTWYIEQFIITNGNDTLPGDNSVNNYVLVAWRDRSHKRNIHPQTEEKKTAIFILHILYNAAIVRTDWTRMRRLGLEVSEMVYEQLQHFLPRLNEHGVTKSQVFMAGCFFHGRWFKVIGLILM